MTRGSAGRESGAPAFRPPAASDVPPAQRWARQPQVAALQAFLAWAVARGLPRTLEQELRALIADFASDSDAPNLELAMRRARRDLVRHARRRTQAIRAADPPPPPCE